MAKSILGISAFYHDSAAAIIVDGRIIAAAQEERFTRSKHTAVFPVGAIEYCLEEAGLAIDDLDAVVFYDKPLLKFERLLETYYAFSPRGLTSFLKAIPIWLDEKLFLKRRIYTGLGKINNYDRKKLRLLFTEHHLSHAASAFYPSPYEHAAILTIDGVGEWATASISVGTGKDITMLKEMNFPHSVGLLYSAFTYFLGFTVNSGEYKLMGLAPYGNPDAEETARYIHLIKTKLVNINEDGSIWLDQKFFNYAVGLQMINLKKWFKLFGFQRREPGAKIQQHHANLALAIQKVTEEIVHKMAAEARKLTGAENLCLAGGVALNCVSNGKLLNSDIFKSIYVQPASNDAGGSLGAALAAHHMYFKKDRVVVDNTDQMSGSLLGPSYSDKEVTLMCRRFKAVYARYADFEQLCAFVSSRIADGKIIGWFQGRMEFGPRALGNRSILADARDPAMQQRLNLKIKYREGFRPFAPSVLREDVDSFFELKVDSPYMMLVAPVVDTLRNSIPEGYHNLPLLEKLSVERSQIPAVTHIDFSARIQTVQKEVNPRFWKLLQAFKKQTGVGVLINTSFNVRGEPIVCTPTDAYRCFMHTGMDYLIINDFLFIKVEQPQYNNKEKWSMAFVED